MSDPNAYEVAPTEAPKGLDAQLDALAAALTGKPVHLKGGGEGKNPASRPQGKAAAATARVERRSALLGGVAVRATQYLGVHTIERVSDAPTGR